jgi:hypothetical protein
MRPVRGVMRRFWIVTLVAAVRALNSLGQRGSYARASAGIAAVLALQERKLPA